MLEATAGQKVGKKRKEESGWEQRSTEKEEKTEDTQEKRRVVAGVKSRAEPGIRGGQWQDLLERAQKWGGLQALQGFLHPIQCKKTHKNQGIMPIANHVAVKSLIWST